MFLSVFPILCCNYRLQVCLIPSGKGHGLNRSTTVYQMYLDLCWITKLLPSPGSEATTYYLGPTRRIDATYSQYHYTDQIQSSWAITSCILVNFSYMHLRLQRYQAARDVMVSPKYYMLFSYAMLFAVFTISPNYAQFFGKIFLTIMSFCFSLQSCTCTFNVRSLNINHSSLLRSCLL